MCCLTTSRPCAHEHELPNDLGMAQRKRLRDISPDREAKNVDPPGVECVYEIGGMVRHRLYRLRRLATRTRNTRVVEQDNRATHGKAVGNCRIPVVHSGAEMRHEDQGRARVLPESAIGKPNAVRFYEMGGSRSVRVSHGRGLAVEDDWRPRLFPLSDLLGQPWKYLLHGDRVVPHAD